MGECESGLKSAFNLSRSYHRLQVGFDVACGCWCGVVMLISFLPVLFVPKDLSPASLGCQATDSIPPQVSRKESLRPLY